MNDAFSYTDYNRIRNNLLYINDKINEMYPDKQETLDLGEAKTGYTNEYRPSEFNAFEKALVSFKRAGINRNLGEPKTYQSNGDFANYNDFIRLEKSCLSWYEATSLSLQSISISPKNLTVISPDTYVFDVSLTPSGVVDKNFTVTLEGDSSQFEVTKEGMKVKVVIKNGNLANATIKVSLQGCEDTASIRVGSGSFFTFQNKVYLYDFVYMGSDLDGEGLATMIGRKVFADFKGCFNSDGVWNENSLDEDAEYRTTIQNFIDSQFSGKLKNALQPTTKWVQQGLEEKYQLTANFFLPSIDEITDRTFADRFIDLRTNVYNYYHDVWTSDEILAERWKDLIIDYRNDYACLLRTIVYESKSGGQYFYSPAFIRAMDNSVYVSGNLLAFKVTAPLRPLFFLDKNTRVKASEVEDLDYEIDWTGQSSIRLCDLSAGQIVGDVGEGQYQYKDFGLLRVRDSHFYWKTNTCTCYLSIGSDNFKVYVQPVSSASVWKFDDSIDWSVSSDDTSIATIEKIDGRTLSITPISVGTTTIRIVSNEVKYPYELTITVKNSQ